MIKVECTHCCKSYDINEDNLGKKAKCSGCGEIFTLHLKKSEKEETKKIIKEEDHNIKPHKNSFVFLWNPIFLFFGIMGILTIVLVSIFDNPMKWFWFGTPIVLFAAFLYYYVLVQYKKESYTITDRKIIHNYGTIFSDNSIEINLDKVTQVSSVLGFVQYKLFKTWTLIIKTAWSSSSKIRLKNIEGTMDIYQNLQGRMQKNGFHLQADTLVQTTKPHWLGVVGEIVKQILSLLLISYYIIPAIILGIYEWTKNIDNDYVWASLWIFLLMAIPLVVVKYLDLKRRKYEIFTDSIFYTEGFLTKNYSFLPMEKVTDTENTQSFFSKIFGLHDVVVSSEWSNNKVSFKNMISGEKMMKNIKYLKDQIIMEEKDIIEGEKVKVNSLIGYKDKVEEPLNYDKEFKGEYKMDMLRTLVWPISIILIIVVLWFGILPKEATPMIGGVIPLFVFLSVWLVIQALFTKFIIDTSSIEMQFKFLSNKHNSFSVEKITSVIIRESLIDKIFNTCSIDFLSIGSSSKIKFSNIKKTADLEKNILAKVGIKKEWELQEVPINFNLQNYIKSMIFTSIIVVIIFAVILAILIYKNIEIVGIIMSFIILAVLVIAHYFYKVFFYNKVRYIQNIYNDFIESISGFFIVVKNYSLLRHVKGITSTKYPLTNEWILVFNIAGEQMVQTKNKQNISIISNSIKIPFVKDVFGIQTKFDEVLNKEEIDRTIITSSRQDIWNSLVGVILFLIISCVYFGFISPVLILAVAAVFAPIIGLTIWIIKVKYYSFEKNRVVFGSGIIYKKRQTILYDKFNFIQKNQGFINKIFNNGIVNIYTVWSGKTEMKLLDIDNYSEIYELLKKD